MTQAILISHPYTNSVATIEIASTKVEEDLGDPNKIKVALPVRKSNQDTTAPSTKVVKLGRLLHIITVYGFLVSDSTSTALQKKEGLVSDTALGAGHQEAPNSIGLLYKSGDLKLTWRAETIKCTLEKIKFIDDSSRDQREGSPDKYELILVLLKGVVR